MPQVFEGVSQLQHFVQYMLLQFSGIVVLAEGLPFGELLGSLVNPLDDEVDAFLVAFPITVAEQVQDAVEIDITTPAHSGQGVGFDVCIAEMNQEPKLVECLCQLAGLDKSLFRDWVVIR